MRSQSEIRGESLGVSQKISRQSDEFLIGALIRMAKRRFQKPGRHIDNRHHPVIRHASWPDHTQHANGIVIDVIRRGNDAAIIENTVARLLANEDPDAVCIDAAIQQIQDQRLARESVEQASP